MIEAIDLSKRYQDGTLALDALNLRIQPGEIYCLLGVPGAGKTTVLNLFLDFTRPTSGQALIDGFEVARHPEEAKRRLAYLSAEVEFYDQLTAIQNLEFFSRLGRRFDLKRDDYAMALREVGLPERTFSQQVATFSKGMRQKLGLATALLKDAPAMLLDEPMTGLDAQAANEIVEILRSFRDRSKAVLLTTQDLFHAKQLADRVGVLKEGRKVLSRSRQELQHQNLETLYLDYMKGGRETEGNGQGAGL